MALTKNTQKNPEKIRIRKKLGNQEEEKTKKYNNRKRIKKNKNNSKIICIEKVIYNKMPEHVNVKSLFFSQIPDYINKL